MNELPEGVSLRFSYSAELNYVFSSSFYSVPMFFILIPISELAIQISILIKQ
mgnify:FL=1